MTLVWQIVDSSNIGGIEKHMAVLTESLRHHGIDARIILLKDHGRSPWIDQLAAAGLTARHLDGTVRGLCRAMKADQPTLVHTHGYKAGILGRLSARLLSIPSVSTFHMGETPNWPVSLYATLDNATSFLSSRIAVSDVIRTKLPFRSTVIPNYIPMPREMPAFAEPPLRLGFVGRLSHEKAPDYFCQLAERFTKSNDTRPNTGRSIEWHVFGDGPMRESLEAQHGKWVTFHGMITDMADAWKSIGLCIMPSRGEGLPLASIEALSAGVPVIASNVGDLNKVVVDGTSGWLVEAHDLDGFSAAIKCWLEMSDIQRKTLRCTAWQHASTHFSERSSLPELFKIYAKFGIKPVAL